MCTGVLLVSLLLSGVDITGAWYRRECMGEVTHLFSLLPSTQSDSASLSGRCLKKLKNFGGWVSLCPVAMTPGLSHLDVV